MIKTAAFYTQVLGYVNKLVFYGSDAVCQNFLIHTALQRGVGSTKKEETV